MSRLILLGLMWLAWPMMAQETIDPDDSNHLKSFYGQKLLLYGGEKIIFQAGTVRDNQAQVPMETRSGDDTVKIVFMLRFNGAFWKIYDLEIQGASVIKSHPRTIQFYHHQRLRPAYRPGHTHRHGHGPDAAAEVDLDG